MRILAVTQVPLNVHLLTLVETSKTENVMGNRKVELTTEGKSLTEMKIQRGIFQGHVLSPLLFVITMMLVNHIVRKCTSGYKLHKSQETNQPPHAHRRHQPVY